MALRIRFQHPSGASLGYSIERLSDGTLYNFTGAAAGSFTAAPAATDMIASLPADSGAFLGRYKATLSSTPAAQFTNGEYCITIHNTAASNAVVAELSTTIYNGDDAPVFPTGGDPWAAPLPGSYAAGSAGFLLGTNLDAKVSAIKARTDRLQFDASDNVKSLPMASVYVGGYSPGQDPASLVWGAAARTLTDKAGYALAASGLDAIAVEPGVNARQALAPILAAAAGGLSGAGTGSIVIKGGNTATTRIMATTDEAGNRTSVTLVLPT